MHDTRNPLQGAEPPSLQADLALERLAAEATTCWQTLFSTLRYPPPLPDQAPSGDPRLDLYVVDEPSTEAQAQVVTEALDLLADHDAASVHVRIPRHLVREGGCPLRQEVGYALALSSLLGLDAAETPETLQGFARHMAHRLAPCPSVDGPRLQRAQEDPSLPLHQRAGAELLARVLDERWGNGSAGVVPALVSLSTQHSMTASPEHRLRDKPTVFDALAATMHDRGRDLGDLFLEVARARVLDLPTPPAWDFQLRATALPRKLGVRRGLSPSGASVVRLELDKPMAAVEVDLAWEAEARFRWTLLRLDAQGHLLGEVEVAALDKVRTVSAEVRHLEDTAAVILVAVSAPERLDPHEPEPPTHGYEVSFFEGR